MKKVFPDVTFMQLQEFVEREYEVKSDLWKYTEFIYVKRTGKDLEALTLFLKQSEKLL